MTESTNQLEIVEDGDVTIDELVDLQQAGTSVLRTAHVGNLSAYNLSLAAAGIPLLTVDHMVTGNDSSYLPESIRLADEDAQMARLGTLVCRTMADQVPFEIANLARAGSFLDEVHHEAVSLALPDTTIFSNTEYLRTNESVSQEVIAIAAAEMPELFKRLALPDGQTERRRDAAGLIRSLGVMQLVDDPRAETTAVMVPNEVDIIINFVVEALVTGEETQYHLSGPAMVQYIKDKTIRNQLLRLYATVKEQASFGDQLPGTVTVRIVPSAEARFATTMARAHKLDGLLAAIEEAEEAQAEIRAERKQVFTSGIAGDAKRVATAEFKDRETALIEPVAKQLSEIPEILAGPGQSGFISQYDVQNEGGLYVPSFNRTRGMKDLAGITKYLSAIRDRFRL